MEQETRMDVAALIDAIRLEKTPDRPRAPLLITEGLPLNEPGIMAHDGMYGFERTSQAFVNFNPGFQPDAMAGARQTGCCC